jgi:NTP pyrophosphatase (non-canonical NTP hydrolase)
VQEVPRERGATCNAGEQRASFEEVLMSDHLQRFERHVGILFKPMETQLEELLHASVGIAGEAGEIIDTVKRHWIYRDELNRKNILEEAGDVLFYTTALLLRSGYTLQEAIDHNVEKLSERYPAGYTDQAARERLDKQEDTQ